MSEPVKLLRPKLVAPKDFAPLPAPSPAEPTSIWRAIRELWEVRACWVCGNYDAAWLEAGSKKL